MNVVKEKINEVHVCSECNDMGFATRANTSNEGEELDGLKIAVSSKRRRKKMPTSYEQHVSTKK